MPRKANVFLLWIIVGSGVAAITLAGLVGYLLPPMTRNAIGEHTSSTDSPGATESILSNEIEPQFTRVQDDTIFFAIGYPLEVEKEDAKEMSVSQYPWLADMVEYGEVMLTEHEAKEFFEITQAYRYFAVSDGKGLTYYDIDLYDEEMAPGIAYVKAFWVGEGPSEKSYQKISSSNYPWLKSAIEMKSRWVPLESSADAIDAKQFIIDQQLRDIEVTTEDGDVKRFTMRYIGEDQRGVN